MEFLIGCNYWASNAGTEMWRQFDAEAIRKDMKILSEHGVKCIRAFPIWRDFQPVMPVLKAGCQLAYYGMENDRECENEYYLQETMMNRFSAFLEICKEYGVQLIIGLITGWMSGRAFIPSALYGKNLLSDPTALYFEQLFIKGFVSRFRDCDAIYAWDLGNECNCFNFQSDRYEATSWTALISNAIRAVDPVRPVISGMHGLELEDHWTIQDQAMFTDMLTTHPYPYFFEEGRWDETLSYRTTMFATAQTKCYAEIGGKPCMAEEVNTIGPMICGNEKQADYIRLNLFSLWANGATGLLWWCNNDQELLNTYPYTENMLERELGLITSDGAPKPTLKEMKKFSRFLQENEISLSPAKTDAVCILTREQNQLAVAFMTHVLSRKAGFNCRFTYAEQPLPESRVYLMPSANGQVILSKKRYDALKQKVYEGATLYLSLDDAIFSGFEELSGLHVIDSCRYPKQSTLMLSDTEIAFSREFHLRMESVGAEVLSYDADSNPVISVNRYGKGKVYVVNFPLEKNLIGQHDAFCGSEDMIYRTIFRDCIDSYPIKVLNDDVVLTYHPEENGDGYAVIINHSAEEKILQLQLDDTVEMKAVFYGDSKLIQPYDACILKVERKK